MDLSAKRVLVVGLGLSGVAATRLALSRGATVRAYDAKSELQLAGLALELRSLGVSLLAGGPLTIDPARTDLVVVSPGVPPLPELAAASLAGIRVIGELEFGYQCLPSPRPIVAVGGTNGKSTTTTLVGAILAATGGKPFVGGNLGEPFCSGVDSAADYFVLEVSSFQLERVERFRPKVSILLNITPDHLDRYSGMDAYAEAKGNAFVHQQPSDFAVVPVSDPVCLRQAQRGAGRVVTFGVGGDIDVRPSSIVDTLRGVEFLRSDIQLSGGHNALNVAAALGAASALGAPVESTRAALRAFRGLAHRTALVAAVNGVRYYDDSKGTNVGASVAALSTLAEAKAVLIAGGRDKGGGYEPLVEALRLRGRAVVLMGEAKEAIASAVNSTVPVFRASTMDEAVRIAAREAMPGDAVLLSPACSSFDMFRDYKHRGDEFVGSVRRLEIERTR